MSKNKGIVHAYFGGKDAIWVGTHNGDCKMTIAFDSMPHWNWKVKTITTAEVSLVSGLAFNSSVNAF